MSEKDPCLAISCHACCHNMRFTGMRVRELLTLLGPITPIALPTSHSLDSFSQTNKRAVAWHANWNGHGRYKDLTSVDPEKKLNVVVNGLCPKYRNGCTIHDHPDRPRACSGFTYDSRACKLEQFEKNSELLPSIPLTSNPVRI